MRTEAESLACGIKSGARSVEFTFECRIYIDELLNFNRLDSHYKESKLKAWTGGGGQTKASSTKTLAWTQQCAYQLLGASDSNVAHSELSYKKANKTASKERNLNKDVSNEWITLAQVFSRHWYKQELIELGFAASDLNQYFCSS